MINVLVELETTKHVCIISTRSCSVLSRIFFENVIKKDLAIVAGKKTISAYFTAIYNLRLRRIILVR